MRAPLPRLLSPVAALALAAALAVAACGGEPPVSTDLSPEAAAGLAVAQRAGCQSCHGSSFAGGVGPTWKGLAGSTVEFDDGTTAVADAEYLTEAIKDPTARQVEGYTLKMPANTLTDAEIAQIVAYIEAL